MENISLQTILVFLKENDRVYDENASELPFSAVLELLSMVKALPDREYRLKGSFKLYSFQEKKYDLFYIPDMVLFNVLLKCDSENHKARYYDYINLTCAYNGVHSLGTGSYMGEGKLTADFVDTTRIFPFINVENDLSFTYNHYAVKALSEKMNIGLEKNLDIRVYGTDYRLMLIYELSKRKYIIEKGVKNGIYK